MNFSGWAREETKKGRARRLRPAPLECRSGELQRKVCNAPAARKLFGPAAQDYFIFHSFLRGLWGMFLTAAQLLQGLAEFFHLAAHLRPAAAA